MIMHRRILILMFIVCVLVSVVPFSALSAEGYSTDFEGFGDNVPAASLTVPGITFVSNSGDWQTYTNSFYNALPYSYNRTLGSFGGVLTMQFASPQATVQFGYMSFNDLTITGYRDSTVVANVTAPRADFGVGAFASLQNTGGFDSLVISAIDDVIIDNITTGEFDAACPIPPLDDAVVGKFVSAAALYWEPYKQTEPPAIIGVGESAWVYGLDETEAFYEIVWSCQVLWVPKDTMGPNYDDVWQGHPLPTTIVGN